MRVLPLVSTILLAASLVLISSAPASASCRIIRDVVYCPTLAKDCIGDVYYPESEASHTSPVVIVVHGGAWGHGSKDDLSVITISQTLVESGFIVFNINYRLSGDGGVFPNDVVDVKKAVEFLVARSKALRIDSTRIGILGISAGAHLALMAAYASEQKFALPQGRSHIKAVVACCPPIFLSEIHKSWVYVYLSDVPQEAPVLYREASPSSYVSTAVLTLLVHGMLDDVIPFSQSERLASALTSAGLQVKLIALKDVGHDFMERSGPAHDQALKELLLFFVTELMQETKASSK